VQSLQGVPVRPGVEQPFWLIEPDNPNHIVILLSGGDGNIRIDICGINVKRNYLVRQRIEFARQGFVVAIVDVPQDRHNLYGFRASTEHAHDIGKVIAFLRARHPGLPLWLIGTSRGTVSAANAAARLHGAAGADGLVLTSSVTRDRKDSIDQTLKDVDLSAITVPTYIVHNKRDQCEVTPLNLADDLLAKLSSVKVKAFKAFSGGTMRPGSDPCDLDSYHDFDGIEQKVVDNISAWVKSH